MKKNFADFEFDDESGILRRAGNPVKASGQTLDLLNLLLRQPGQTVSREEIQRQLWPDRNVEFDHNLDVLVNRLRAALGDTGVNPRFIRTIPKTGYKFVEPVIRAEKGLRRRPWLRRIGKYAAVAVLAALIAILFVRTRYRKFVPHSGEAVSRTESPR